MRGRISGKITGVHTISFMEAHEITHGRGNKFAALRHFHIDVGIGHNRSAVRVHDLPVNARMVIDLFLQDLERSGLG
jgi:hypothetical protein